MSETTTAQKASQPPIRRQELMFGYVLYTARDAKRVESHIACDTQPKLELRMELERCERGAT